MNFNDLFNFELAYNSVDAKGEEKLNEYWKEEFNKIEWGRDNSKTRDQIDAIGSVIIEDVRRIVDLFNPISLFYEMAKGELGKTLEGHEVFGGKVYERAYGGYAQVSGLKSQKFSVTSRPWAVHLQFAVEKMKVGKITLVDINSAISSAILTHKVKLAIDTLVDAYPTTSSYYTAGGGVAVTQAALNDDIDQLADRGSGQVIAVARYKTLSPIKSFTGAPEWSDDIKDEIHAKGFLGKYNGARLVSIHDYTDDMYAIQPMASTNLFLVDPAKKMNRFVEVNGLERTSYQDPLTNRFGIIVRFEDGAAVWKDKFGHRIGALP